MRVCHLTITIINASLSFSKLQTNNFQLVSSWLLDCCLILVGCHLVLAENEAFSYALVFIIVFAQYQVLSMSTIDLILSNRG